MFINRGGAGPNQAVVWQQRNRQFSLVFKNDPTASNYGFWSSPTFVVRRARAQKTQQALVPVVAGGPKAIAPDTGINATSSITASVVRLRPVTPDTGINATSSVTASIGRLRPITPAAINATSAVTAAVGRLRPVVPSAISSTSAVTASIERLRPITPASITSTSTVTAGIVRLRVIKPAAISATSTITATLSKVGHPQIGASITATSTVGAVIGLLPLCHPILSSVLDAAGVLSPSTPVRGSLSITSL